MMSYIHLARWSLLRVFKGSGEHVCGSEAGPVLMGGPRNSAGYDEGGSTRSSWPTILHFRKGSRVQVFTFQSCLGPSVPWGAGGQGEGILDFDSGCRWRSKFSSVRA